MYENEKDILMRAGTGKGKTFAYLLPILNQLYTENKMISLVQPNSLLKTQSRGILERFFTSDEASIKSRIKIVTPRQLLESRDFDMCVVDEADLSLSPACLPPKMKLRSFLQEVIGGKRIIYVGATYPVESSKRSLKSDILAYNPATRMIEDDTTVDELSIEMQNEHFIILEEFGVLERNKKLMEILAGVEGNVMVFVKDKVVLSGLQRLKLEKRVIMTTDLMARGYDINSLQAVIHYNPPMSAVDYVHRVGRLNRLNSVVPRDVCKSYCLLGREDLESGPTFLRLLLNSRMSGGESADMTINSDSDVLSSHVTTSSNTNTNHKNTADFRLSKLFSRNRSINKQIKRNKL